MKKLFVGFGLATLFVMSGCSAKMDMVSCSNKTTSNGITTEVTYDIYKQKDDVKKVKITYDYTDDTTNMNNGSEDTNNTEQTTKPNSQTSPSKVAASQVAEKPLTDNEKIEIIKEEYSDEEINARISDNEENDDSNIIAAASSNASANIVKTTNTDDKLTRKLSRFNNDSIIESRKKMKKVQAVSAASGKKA